MSHLQGASTGAFAGRVGSKAGGFIAKKFFHPSSFRNQEKLWKAQETKREHDRRQEDLQRKREEERRVEILRQGMYEATGDSAAVGEVGVSMASTAKADLSIEERISIEEMQKRKRAAMINAVDDEMTEKKTRKEALKSKYTEDIHPGTPTYGTKEYAHRMDKDIKSWHQQGYYFCPENILKQRDGP